MKKRLSAAALALTLLLQGCGASKNIADAGYPSIKDDYRCEGHLEEVFFKSTEKGMTFRRAWVYLPKDYYRSLTRYPVLYLLHGARSNECVWIDDGKLLRSIDSLCSCGAMSETIVVLPNVNQYNNQQDYGNARHKGALESFFEVDGMVESRFICDVVSATDSIFRTIPDKEHRAVAGLSIGAMQSIHLSANSPDSFGYVGIFSPMVHSVLKPGEENRFYSNLKRKQKVQFENPPQLYLIMIGKADFFHPSTERWTKRLSRRGYPYEYICTSGGHEWDNWSEFCKEFLQRLWK